MSVGRFIHNGRRNAESVAGEETGGRWLWSFIKDWWFARWKADRRLWSRSH